MSGWFKVHRELYDKPIWVTSTPEQKVILMTLLSMANFEPKEWEWKGQRYKVQPGQFITSLPSIAEKCGKGVSIQNIRTALKRFEKYDFLTDESTKQNRLITIANWSIYQGLEKSVEEDQQASQQTANSQLTDDQQTANSQLTASKNLRTKELKKDKELKKEILPELPFGRIIDYLNRKAGTNFRASSAKTQILIRARFNEKFTADDFKSVIDVKCAEWMNTDQQKYLRPETLFGTKFESYLNQKPKGIGTNGPVRKNEAAFARTIGADGNPVRYGLPNQ